MSAGFVGEITSALTHNSITLTYALNAATTSKSATYIIRGSEDTPTAVNNDDISDTSLTISGLLEGTEYNINFLLKNSADEINLVTSRHTTRGFETQPTITDLSDTSVTLVYVIKKSSRVHGFFH